MSRVGLKPFTSIPGPKSLPIIGALYKYFPYFGEYTFKRLHWNGLKKYRKYGPLVRERFGDVNVLWVFDPVNIREIFANDGKYPMRRSHLALQKYRLERPHMYSSGGLLPTNGEEWWRMRKESQKVLNRVASVRANLPVANEICSDFIKLIEEIKDENNEIDDFIEPLEKQYVEIMMNHLLDVRINCVRPSLKEDSEAALLMWSNKATNNSIVALDNGLTLWNYFDTPLYKKLIKGQDNIYKIAQKYVNRKEKSLKEDDGLVEDDAGVASGVMKTKSTRAKTLLEFFLIESSLSKIDIMTNLCDFLMGASGTTTHTTSFLLYHLAMNPEKQQILAEEARRLLHPTAGKVTASVLDNATYMKAVLKETLRLNPASVGSGRLAATDISIGGYAIPKGTILVTQTQITSRLPEYIDKPNEFLPERWLEEKKAFDYFITLPFGHGARSCIGRRMGEQGIFVTVLRIISEYHIVWSGEPDIDCYTLLLNVPDKPLKFTFTKRQ